MSNLFLKNGCDCSDYIDATFGVSFKASQDPEAVNLTLGSLCEENGTLSTFDSVYRTYDHIADRAKARYASEISGNADFIETIYHWLNREENLQLAHRTLATAGGTGALSLVFANALEAGETVLLPYIGWGTYKLMAKQQHLQMVFYQLVDEKDEISLDDLFAQSKVLMAKQHKLLVLINDPAHNPTGLCYGKERWEKIIAFYNELSKEGKVILLNDIAYFDYVENSRDCLSTFNQISENMLIAIALSCSKTFSAYGQRLGACILLAQQEKDIREVYNAFIRTIRTSWGSVNNGFMDTVVKVLNENRPAFLKDIEAHRALLKERAEIFLKEARKVNLPMYPYGQGFFITVRIPDEKLIEKVHARMMEKHIYTAHFADGLRISICCATKKICQKLPAQLKEIIEECAHE